MILFDGQALLLDVEGTTSSISFVYDVLFAYAKKHVADFLAHEKGSESVRAVASEFATEASLGNVSLDDSNDLQCLVQAALDWMNKDIKSTPLKALQGMIWRHGFESGELVSHIFDDVPQALAQWADSGLDVRIYSSGSVQAQKLFFSHTSAGNLTRYLQGYYDTTTGPKREASSYTRIAADMNCDPRRVLFLSDVGAELDAARQAGMATALAIRPGNKDAGGLFDHQTFSSFSDIVI